MSDIDGETWGKIVGGIIGGLALWFTSKKASEARKTAPENTPPTAMGIVLDGDTALAIRDELRLMHADMVKWRSEDRDKAKDDKIEELEERIAHMQKGQGRTHGELGEMAGVLAEIREALAVPGVAEEVRRHRQIRDEASR